MAKQESTKPAAEPKPETIPSAEVLAILRDANNTAAANIETVDRSLVTKLHALMSRKRNPVTVAEAAAAIDAHKKEQGKDLLGWSASYARHIGTVNALMKAPDSRRYTIRDLFVLAADLHARDMKDADGAKITGRAKTAAIVAGIEAHIARPEEQRLVIEEPQTDGSTVERVAGPVEELRVRTKTRDSKRKAHTNTKKEAAPVAPEVAIQHAADDIEAALETFAAYALANPSEVMEHAASNAADKLRAALASLDSLIATLSEMEDAAA